MSFPERSNRPSPTPPPSWIDWYHTLSLYDKEGLLIWLGISACDAILFAVYLASADPVVRTDAALGIYFFAACMGLLALARRRDVILGSWAVLRRRPTTVSHVTDMLWMIAL